jgi:hypothetical protein
MAKKLKIQMPKRVAGIKIPKSVRKGALAKFLNSTAGQVVLAQALVVAAGAFGASRTDPDSPVGELVRHPLEGSRRIRKNAAKVTSDQAERLSNALREAARAFQTAMQAQAPVEDDWPKPASDVEGERSSKKKSTSRSDPLTPH